MAETYFFEMMALPQMDNNKFFKNKKIITLLESARSLVYKRKFNTFYGINMIFLTRPKFCQDPSLGVKNTNSLNLSKSNVKNLI